MQQPEVNTAQCSAEEEGVTAVGTAGHNVQLGTHVGTGDESPTGLGEPMKAVERSESDAPGEPTAVGMTLVRRVSITVGLR